MLNYLLSQDWFFRLDFFVESLVVEDSIFDELEVYEYRERLAFARAFYHFAEAIHVSLDEYRIQKDWVRLYLVKSGTLDRYTRDVIFLASIPVKTRVIQYGGD